MKRKILSSTLALSVMFGGTTALTSLQNQVFANATVQSKEDVKAYQKAWETDAKMYADYYRTLEKQFLAYSEVEDFDESMVVLQKILNVQINFQKKVNATKNSGIAEVDKVKTYFKQMIAKDIQWMNAFIKYNKELIDDKTFLNLTEEYTTFSEETSEKILDIVEAFHKKYNIQPNMDTMYLTVGEVDMYKVKKGDTLYSIAAKHHMTVAELKELNGLKSNVVKPGQYIYVVSLDFELPKVSYTYVVKKGDYLDMIARKYGLTVNQLKQYNNLKSNVLKTGQVLIVKKIHTVQKGDTLQKISKKYNVSIEKLKEMNGLLYNTVFVGQKLVIK